MITPTKDYRKTDIVAPRKLPEGLDALLSNTYEGARRNVVKLSQLQKEAAITDSLGGPLRECSDVHLRNKLNDFKKFYRRAGNVGQAEDEKYPEALAALAEAAYRQVKLRPYFVQLMGAVALSRGMLTEMATGEGKTLTIALAAVTAGWTQLPCHIITANDYLAERDARTMRPFYDYCGVSVGFVTGKMSPQERQVAYKNDIVYTTSKEILADFLRDRLRLGDLQNASRRVIRYLFRIGTEFRDQIIMRGIHTCIVDEADNLLIDEAVTPLIISQPRENKALIKACMLANDLADDFTKGRDYKLDEKFKQVELTNEAVAKIDAVTDDPDDFYSGGVWMQQLVIQAVKAREYFKRDVQYVVQDDKVVIVDEYTGRLMPGRSWKEGLHQAIEAKEGVTITNPSESLARLSFQRFFRFFKQLSGITGTAKEAATEFWHIYGLPFVAIPTNRPCIRSEVPDQIFTDADSKWNAVVEEIVAVHKKGRPILVGTRSVASSEHLAKMLMVEALNFRLLNAIHHQQEAMIVSLAGNSGTITIATNMAGRGTDIKLDLKAVGSGGLHVIATERHESHRIDRQLFGRAARQGDVGSASAFTCLDDELMTRFSPKWVKRLLKFLFRKQLPGAWKLARVAFTRAQHVAQKMAYLQRKNVMKQDTWVDDSFSSSGPDVGL